MEDSFNESILECSCGEYKIVYNGQSLKDMKCPCSNSKFTLYSYLKGKSFTLPVTLR